jgi:hypothetical protein
MRRLVIALFVTAATPALAAPAPVESWGKAGISLNQYRADAVECGRAGYYLDISRTEDAKAFVRASKQLELLPTAGLASTTTTTTTSASAIGDGTNDATAQAIGFAGTQQHIIDNVRPKERMHDLEQLLQATVDRCLAGRGYSKFRLTDDQRRQLRRLKLGSEQRHTFLYQLASSPAVLQTQRIDPQQ